MPLRWPDAAETLLAPRLPLATLLTPNLPQAAPILRAPCLMPSLPLTLRHRQAGGGRAGRMAMSCQPHLRHVGTVVATPLNGLLVQEDDRVEKPADLA